jgi:hypothetical protein
LITPPSSVIRKGGTGFLHQAGAAPARPEGRCGGIIGSEGLISRSDCRTGIFFRGGEMADDLFRHNPVPPAPKGMAGYGGWM